LVCNNQAEPPRDADRVGVSRCALSQLNSYQSGREMVKG
jgi:hypothetical protein